MSFSYLQVNINGNRRKHVCQLNESFNDERAFEFLIERSRNETVNLLNVGSNDLFSCTIHDEFIQKKVSNLNRSVVIKRNKPTKEVTVTISLSMTGTQNPGVNDEGVDVNFEHGLDINFEGAVDNDTETVKVRFLFDQESYLILFHLCKTKPKRLVLDFGSEASQIGYEDEQGPTRVNMISILQNMDDCPEEKDGFYQRDKSEGLFRTNFFVKEEWSDFKPHARPFSDDKFPLIFLCDGHPREAFPMPNIKLVLSSNQEVSIDFNDDDTSKRIFCSDESFEVEKHIKLTDALNNAFSNVTPVSIIHRVIINHFFHICLSKFSTAKAINFVLLVPNIYTQERVFQIINDFYFDLKQIRADYEEHADLKVEFSVVPEGMGPLQYLLFEQENFDIRFGRNETYLLTDVGKGTTEISIVSTGEKNIRDLTSLYSSGIPAAGNIINAYWWKQRIRQGKYDISGVEDQMRVAGAIDTEKISVQQGIDRSAYIRCVAKKYAENVISEMDKAPIRLQEINKIILTGRGLLFKPLLEVFKTELHLLIRKNNVDHSGTKEARGWGIGNLFKAKKVEVRLSEENIEYLEKPNEPEMAKEIAVYGPLYGDWMSSNDGHDFVLGKETLRSYGGVQKKTGPGSLLEGGVNLKVKADDRLHIGRWGYEWSGKDTLAGEEEGILIYTGRGFAISLNKGKPIDLDLAKSSRMNSLWLEASLFPYNSDNLNDIRDIGCDEDLPKYDEQERGHDYEEPDHDLSTDPADDGVLKELEDNRLDMNQSDIRNLEDDDNEEDDLEH